MNRPIKALVSLFFLLNLLINCSAEGKTPKSLPVNSDIQKEICLIRTTQYVILHFGDSIWENISDTPLRILLITDSLEYLFNHDSPNASFEWYQYDSSLCTNIYVRPRKFPVFLRATFPAVNGIDCIVAGNTQNTEKSDEDWIIMLLHEHFHLYQNENPQYKKNISLLAQKISKGNDNWMLDYNFPYNDTIINELFKEYTSSVYNISMVLNNKNTNERVIPYVPDLSKIQNLMDPDDYDYFRFQIWQEGIATYTEYQYLKILSKNSNSFKESRALDYALKDEKLLKDYTKYLLETDLRKSQRNLFYSLGLLEGIINDEINPEWKTEYFKLLNSKIIK